MNLGGLINSSTNMQVAKNDLPNPRTNQDSNNKSFDKELSNQNSDHFTRSNKESSKKLEANQSTSLERNSFSSRPLPKKSNLSESGQSISNRFESRNSEIDSNSSTVYKSTDTQKIELEAADEKAILMTFLNRMEKEVGVEPEKLIEAFGQLSVEELLAPPEESIGSLIDSLELPEEKSEKASLLFSQMLGISAANDLATELASNNQKLNIQVTDKEQARKAEVQKSLTQLSDQFFMKNEFKAPQVAQKRVASAYQKMAMQNTEVNKMPPQSLPESTGSNFQAVDTQTLENEDLSQMALSALGANEVSEESKMGIDISGLEKVDTSDNDIDIEALLKELKSQDTQEQSEASNAAKTNAAVGQEFNNEIFENIDVEIDPKSHKTSAHQSESQNIHSKHGSENLVSMTQQLDKESGSTDQKESSERGYERKNSDVAFNGQGQVNDKARTEFKSFMINQPQANATHEAENTKEIINKAQVLIKNGGGEMKVQLNPAGVGEVNLKVMVKNGQVNVEMVADSKHAKEVIEKGLGDLKSTLAEHKLNLDKIKVDVSTNLGSELSQQQGEMERQSQQKFLQDFQQQNQAFRNSLLGLPGPRVGRSQESEDQVADLLQAQQTRSSRGDRKLDLIA